MKFHAIASTALVAALLLPLESRAAEVNRDEIRPAADVCRPALPAFDGMIRTRPLGLVNESSSVAWITCALTGHHTGKTRVIDVRFIGAGNGPRTCTLVSWQPTNTGVAAVGYQTLSSSTLPGWETKIRWTAAVHNGGATYASMAVSCQLPPGDGIESLRQMFLEEVGQ